MREKKIILIVDDDERTRKIFCTFLGRFGYEVLSAENGKKGIEALKNNEVDLVLLDINMPEMDGIEALGIIKKEFAGIPVIMITAVSEVEVAVRAMKLGATDYVRKPAKTTELLEAVEAGLRKGKERDTDNFDLDLAMMMDKAGLVVFFEKMNEEIEMDEDVFAGMFSALKMFIKDSFHSDGDLTNIKHGEHSILVEEGRGYYLAFLGQGDNIRPVRGKMREVTGEIDRRWSKTIRNWKGDAGALYDMKAHVKKMLSERMLRKDRKRGS